MSNNGISPFIFTPKKDKEKFHKNPRIPRR
jgi:hypothetical protein